MKQEQPVGWCRRAIGLLAMWALTPLGAWAQEAVVRAEYRITRANGEIKIDADLSDAGWQGATRIDTWYETKPGDNVEPKAASVAWLTYDDKYFYAAFDFSDPDPKNIRAPFAEQDNLSIAHDYGGVFIDSSNDGKTAFEFLATARGVQFDAINSDGSGEDSAPDFHWDSRARITATGWILEMRIPFSSLRYPHTDPQTWGILLFRNWPRNHHTQIFSTPMRRGHNCFVCQSAKLTGLSGLPRGGHWSFAPYATARQIATPVAGPGTKLREGSIETDIGLDAKWTPDADTAVDLTINPDFSQVEADVAQISANERFALLYPEKRPFFLEGKDLFNTPIQAVHTRTVTEPDWGLRATGRIGTASYTVLTANDVGGGSVVLPGSTGSSFADQDFKSIVGVARMRYDIGSSFVSFLGTVREVEGDGYNRVFGPDFTWRHNSRDRVSGQLLFSRTLTPNRPDLADEWDGRKLNSYAGQLWWSHSTATLDWFMRYRDVGEDFRADNGFVPQVGYRAAFGETGYTFRPEENFFTRIRTFLFGERVEDMDRNLLNSYISLGAGADGGLSSFMRARYAVERVRSGDEVFPRNRVFLTLQSNPSQAVSNVFIDAFFGQDVDFANSRAGHGGSVALRASLRPTDRLELNVSANRRWVDVAPDGGDERRLFTAQVYQLRSTYAFTARAYVRLIGQYVFTDRNPALYTYEIAPHDKSFSGTALFTYKLNWQSVMFVGYGDERALDNTVFDDDTGLDKVSRQWFLKLSYAFQAG